MRLLKTILAVFLILIMIVPVLVSVAVGFIAAMSVSGLKTGFEYYDDFSKWIMKTYKKQLT